METLLKMITAKTGMLQGLAAAQGMLQLVSLLNLAAYGLMVAHALALFQAPAATA